MTRQYFIDNVNDWWELKDFCNDEDCEICSDVYGDEDMDEEINDAIREYSDDYQWYELRDLLRDIPSGYNFYYRNSSFDWEGLDDNDFNSYKDDVLEWMDNGDYWDDEDDAGYDDCEETLSAEPEDDDEEPAPAEDFSVGDLMGMCSASFVTMQQESLRMEQESNDAFRNYVQAHYPKVLHRLG